MMAGPAFPKRATAGSGWITWVNRLQRHRNLLTGLLLMLAAWTLYLPSVWYGFVYYDDVRILRDHPELYGQASLAQNFRAIFVTAFPREEPLPLRDVSWALDSWLFGFGNASGHHFGNVLLHGGVVALLFGFLLDTTRRYGFALAVAAAYLAVGVHTEPVAWIMGRKDILSAAFMLVALWAQTRRLRTDRLPARYGWYAITLLCLLGGLLSKISVLTFPLVLFLHAVFLPYLDGTRPRNGAFIWGYALLRELLLFVPGLVVSIVVYGWYRQTLTQMGILDRGYSARGLDHLWNLLMINPMVLWVYLKQTFFPWQFSVLYPWPKLLPAFPAWHMTVSLASAVAAGGAGFWLWRRRKDLFFYYAAFFVLMVPYLNLVYVGIWVADRYLYFSVFCLLAMAVSLASAALQSPHPVLRLGMIVVAACSVGLNGYQKLSYQPVWRNGETLWQYHLALPQPSPTAYGNLAAGYYANFVANPESPGAEGLLRKMSVVVEAGLSQFWPDRRQSPPPETYFLFFLRSLVQEITGQPEAALASLQTADRLHPRFDATQLNLARLHHKLAAATTNPSQRRLHACAARERFAQYLALAYRNRPLPPEVKKEQAELEAGCPVANQRTERPAKSPGPEQ